MTGKKFVAVLNKKIEPGKAMNALAHMTAGMVGNYDDVDDMAIINYEDKDGGAHEASKHPFIILRAKNSNQLRTFRNALIEKSLPFSSFTQAMTVGGYQEQIEASKATAEEDLEYYGVVTFAASSDLDELTRKFSLWN